MSSATLMRVLAATGYLPDGNPAAGLRLGGEAKSERRGRRVFSPDALWRSPSSLTIYFKFEQATPPDELVGKWRREVWNEGFAPLLWVISPARIDLYNGFGAPVRDGDAEAHRIRSFEIIDGSLAELDALAGRLSIETGQFWTQVQYVDRKTSVDARLLADLAAVEFSLVGNNLERHAAQALIGRVIFTQYLVDREIVGSVLLKRICGHASLPPILRDRAATGRLFGWLSETFNGDMFPPSSARNTPASSHLARVADFLEAVDPLSGQTNIFPYQFNVIPVELISSIYEQFAHARPSASAHRPSEAVTDGVHYTRLCLVSLVLDEVMDGLKGDESVLDLSCGSGVFLVEALRRLVHLRAGGQPPTRELIRSTLHEQVYGVDISEPAVRVAAFSLYLAALELDPDPQPPRALTFRPLIGKTLLIGDAHTVERSDDGKAALVTAEGLKRFDLIVGNPPWSFKGHAGTSARRAKRSRGIPAQPRGEGLDFVCRAAAFSHERTRFGVVLSATSFFSRSITGRAAAQYVMRLLAPVTLVNLSSLSSWLFATATMPAVVLFARHRSQRSGQVTVVQVPWTESGAKTHTFEISPSDIVALSLAAIEARPTKLKAAAIGRRRDLALLESLEFAHPTLGAQFATLNAELNVGLTRGLPRSQTTDASYLKGLELLEADAIERFRIPNALPKFALLKAHRPRPRDIYRAPILIVKETLSAGPRAIVAVADRDVVYTNAFFGASLPASARQSACLVAAILSSSFASWFFLMAASEFGIWKRRLLRHDVALLPTPDLKHALKAESGKQLLRVVRRLEKQEPAEDDWQTLDQAVFDLYDLDESDRVVVRDGLFRASWQWQAGREASVAPADVQRDVVPYGQVFLRVMGRWLSARNKRHMRAEVVDLPERSALRVVRFVLEDGPGIGGVDIVEPVGGLNEVLDRIGTRLRVKLATALSGERELRIHGRNEVVIIKPAARRFWMGSVALEDADAVVAESFVGNNT